MGFVNIYGEVYFELLNIEGTITVDAYCGQFDRLSTASAD